MDVKGKPLKPDKLALKNKLYQDKEDITKEMLDCNNIIVKTQLKKSYDLVCSYIEICVKRNKF